MRKSLLFLVQLAIAQLTYSQTTCGNFYFQTQAEVDQFALDYPDCVEADAIWIEILGGPTGITDLSALSNLTTINIDLSIYNYSGEFVTTSDFVNLSSVGSLYLENVNEPDGFISLSQVTGNLTIVNFDAEGFEGLSLDGFANLQSAGSINLAINNPNGIYMDVFPNLVTLDNLHIGGWQGSGGFQFGINVNTLNGFNQVTNMQDVSIGITNFGTPEEIDNFEILNSLISATSLSFDYLVSNEWDSFASLESLDYLYCLTSVNDEVEFPSLTYGGNFLVWLDGSFTGQDYSFPVLQTLDMLTIWEWTFPTPTNVVYQLTMPALETVTTNFYISGDNYSTSGANYFTTNSYDFGSLLNLPNLHLDGTSLESLSIFNSVVSIEGAVSIIANQNLSMCSIEALCNKIGESINPEEIIINGNDVGCDSVNEVSAYCNGNYISGHIYSDTDCNQILDTNDPVIDFAMISNESDLIISSSSSIGFYLLSYNPGESLQYQINHQGYIPTGLLTSTPTEPYGPIVQDILVCPDLNYHDVSIQCDVLSPPRPGFTIGYHLTISNHSANIETLATTIDLSDLPNYTLVECDGCQENGTYLEYADQELNAFESIQLTLVLQIPQNVAIGSEWDISGYITASADNQNNVDDDAFVNHRLVVGSYDPNDISVDRAAINFENYNTNGEWLNYQIRFQNTGNYPAEFISVLNGLDDELDMNTLQIIETSHDAQLFFNENRELEFYFENIQLPDSTSDPEGSNGFIRYRIKTNEGLNLGSFIESTAAIYFDYNEPVITNTATTEFYVCPASLHPSGGIDICYDAEITLEADASWETYQWSVNGNALGTSSAQSFDGLNEGPNNVVIAAETEFCEASVEYEIYVMDELEIPVIILNANELSVSPSGMIDWFLNDELIATDTPSIMVQGAGEYVAVMSNGICSSTSSVYLIEDEVVCTTPELAPYPSSICAGESIDLSVTGDYESYIWYNGLEEVGQGENISTVMMNEGNYAFSLLALNPTCSWTLEFAVQVNDVPDIPLITQDAWTLATDAEGDLSWSYDGAIIGTGTSVEITWIGEYALTATVDGCASSTASVAITLCGFDESELISGPSTICQNLSANIQIADLFEGYQVLQQGAWVETGTIYELPSANLGIGVIEFQIVAQGCIQNIEHNFYVLAIPSAPSVIQSGNTLTASGTGSYAWTLDGIPLATTSSTLEMTQSGAYGVAVSLAGCMSEWTEGFYTYTSVEELENNNVVVYPNPAMDKLQIAANRLSATDVLVLINVEGQIIELNKGETNIDVSPLARGLYLMQSRDATGQINWQEHLILQ